MDGSLMRLAGETIGIRGLTVLAAAGAVGIVLGLHGWSVRHSGPPSSFAGPAPSAGPASAPVQGPTAAPTPTSSASSASPSPSARPKLSAEPFARYAFQLWPGPVSQAAKTAATGLVVRVRKHGSGITVVAGVVGQSRPVSRFYRAGAKVYVVEAALGDDSGNTDYNLGDDALVVTDAHGRIVQ